MNKCIRPVLVFAAALMILAPQKGLVVQQTSVSSANSNTIKVYPNPGFDIIQVQTDNIEESATYTMTK